MFMAFCLCDHSLMCVGILCVCLHVCMDVFVSVIVCTTETAKFENPVEELKKENEFPSLVFQSMCDMFGDNNVQKSADSTIRIAMDNFIAKLDPFALVCNLNFVNCVYVFHIILILAVSSQLPHALSLKYCLKIYIYLVRQLIVRQLNNIVITLKQLHVVHTNN